MRGPDPRALHPIPAAPRVAFLRPLAEGRENVEVGDYTYADDADGPEHFFERSVLYHYPWEGDRLVIGRFCAIAEGVRFVMNGANHAMAGFSTYPFEAFGSDWGAAPAATPGRGDTIVGHDVWIGREAMILPGTRIGSGAIVGARAVVSGEVPPYAVAVGNPARVTRLRFDPETVARLLAAAWWDWPPDRIARNLAAIRGADIAALEAAR